MIIHHNLVYILKVNSKEMSLPYESKMENVFVAIEGNYIVFRTNFFNIWYDGDQYLKLSKCGKKVCGICQALSDSYLVQDIKRNCSIVI